MTELRCDKSLAHWNGSNWLRGSSRPTSAASWSDSGEETGRLIFRLVIVTDA